MKTTDTTETAGASQNVRKVSVVKIDPRYKLEKVVAATKQCRLNIENIKLDKTARFGNCAIATNGRSLAIVPVEVQEGENDKGLISVEALKASRKNKPLDGVLMLAGKIELPASAMPRPTESETGEFAMANGSNASQAINRHLKSALTRPCFST